VQEAAALGSAGPEGAAGGRGGEQGSGASAREGGWAVAAAFRPVGRKGPGPPSPGGSRPQAGCAPSCSLAQLRRRSSAAPGPCRSPPPRRPARRRGRPRPRRRAARLGPAAGGRRRRGGRRPPGRRGGGEGAGVGNKSETQGSQRPARRCCRRARAHTCFAPPVAPLPWPPAARDPARLAPWRPQPPTQLLPSP
jgi:hypothetical protein